MNLCLEGLNVNQSQGIFPDNCEHFRFNPGAILLDGGVMLLPREVLKESLRPNQADKGEVGIFIQDGDTLERMGTLNLKKGDSGIGHLEDFRIKTLGRNFRTGERELVSASTAILEGSQEPRIAVAYGIAGKKGLLLDEPKVLEGVVGKNGLFLEENKLLYRAEGDDLVLTLGEVAGTKFMPLKRLDFSDPGILRWWFSKRVGMGAGAVALPNRDTLLDIHGIYEHKEVYINSSEYQGGLLRYSFGYALLDSNIDLLDTTADPSDIREELPPGELHSFRLAMYKVGMVTDQSAPSYRDWKMCSFPSYGDIGATQSFRTVGEALDMFRRSEKVLPFCPRSPKERAMAGETLRRLIN